MTKQTKTQALVAAAALLTAAQEPLKVGDVVVWKDGLQNKRFPDYGEPVVVTRTYATPCVSDHDTGSPYFNEGLDCALLRIDEDNDAMEHHADSRRLRLATKAEIDAWDAKNAD